MEWGCMQALIDFDGWRKWKDFSQSNKEDEAKKKKKGNRASLVGNAMTTSRTAIKEENESPAGTSAVEPTAV